MSVIRRDRVQVRPRYPARTPYAGPNHNYDDQIDPDQLIRRLVYGRTAPLLGPYERIDGRFYGRLLDDLSNAHVVLVKVSTRERTCRNFAAALKRLIPKELYGVAVDFDPHSNEWSVLAFNQIPMEMRRPPRQMSPDGENWIDMQEVGRMLNVSCDRAREIVKSAPIESKREGARAKMYIRQRDVALLANRPRRWRKKKIVQIEK